MAVEVLVPWRGGCPHRKRAWAWVRGRYRRHQPRYKAVLAPDRSARVWCKARALQPALEAAKSEVVIVADADVWTDGLERAVLAVTCGLADWAVPHRFVYRLNEDSTAKVLAGEQTTTDMPLARRRYEGVAGGGIVVARRETLLDIPLDPRFVSWGQEDMSWGVALQCLAGRCWRGTADLFHLWHPLQTRLTGKRGSAESWNLWQRYHRAGVDPAAMRKLIQEANPQ